MKTTKRQKTRKALLIITFLIFPALFYYLSPYLIIDGTMKGIVTGSFLFFALLFISSLVLGRAYCGWICPASGIQDQIAQVNDKKIKRGNLVKWIIWVPWILFIILLSIKNGGYHQVDPLYQTTYGLSIGNVYALITYLLVLLLIVAPAFIFGRRSFCHSLCWMAPFMILGRKISNLLRIPSLQLKASPENCTNCQSCSSHCPMSLPVDKMVGENNMEHSECILCGTCIDGCKSKAIKFEFKSKK